jgi:hypothetical protein
LPEHSDAQPPLHLRFKLDPLDLYVRHVQPLMDTALQRVLKWMLPCTL